MKKIRIAVMMGGDGSEREVSVMSGNEVIRNLNATKYNLVDIMDKPEIVFIAMHGKYGEDGTVQKELEDKGIKFTGSLSEVCRLGMDKIAFKEFAKELGAVVPNDVKMAPCVVKPNKGGSSFGVTIVKDQKDLEGAIEFAKKYDDRIIVEEYIKGTEVSCGVIKDGLALPVIEICPKTGFFDYEAKDIQTISSLIFKKMKCRGFVRLDYIIRKNIPYLLEINMIPGLTPNSLLPKEALVVGISFGKLLDIIIEESI